MSGLSVKLFLYQCKYFATLNISKNTTDLPENAALQVVRQGLDEGCVLDLLLGVVEVGVEEHDAFLQARRQLTCSHV